jgi:hypothetical protein
MDITSIRPRLVSRRGRAAAIPITCAQAFDVAGRGERRARENSRITLIQSSLNNSMPLTKVILQGTSEGHLGPRWRLPRTVAADVSRENVSRRSSGA